MRLGTKGRLAVDSMIDLALRDAGGPVPLTAVCGRLGVSLSYLEQVVARLRRAGLVVPTRGPGGGYTLGREAAAITLADIVASADDAAPHVADGLHELCAHLDRVMLAHMATITLASLRDAEIARGVQVEVRAPKRKPVLAVQRPMVPNSVFAFGRSFAE